LQNVLQNFSGGWKLQVRGKLTIRSDDADKLTLINRMKMAFSGSTYRFRAACWCLAVLVLIEILLRGTTFWFNGKYAYTIEMGSRPAQGSRVLYGQEGFGITHYSGFGEIATPYAGGSNNIVVMGNSYAEGLNVNDTDKFVSVAETILRRDGFDVDLRNIGRSGQTIVDQIYLAPYVIEQYHPLIVVIQATVRAFERTAEFVKGDSNQLVISNDGRILVRHQPEPDRDNAVRAIGEFFSILDYGRTRFKQIRSQALKSPGQNPDYAVASVYPVSKDIVMHKVLNKLREAFGSLDLVIVLIPPIPEVHNNRLTEPDFTQYQMIKQDLESIPNVHVVDPSAEFLISFRNHRPPSGFLNTIPGTGHVNAVGHQIIGENLAKILERLIK